MRKVIFANGEIYHIFNRGVEKRPIFINKRDYNRALQTLDYYRYSGISSSLSQVLKLEKEKRDFFLTQLKLKGKRLVGILSFCLMPNHFHLLLKQLQEDGIKTFLSNFSNSYTKYFNIKSNRVGPLLQGIFKAVRIEDDNQLVHVCRYIHINPVVSLVIKGEELIDYPYTSLPEYLKGEKGFCNKEEILSYYSSVKKFENFIFDQIDYGKRLESIKHLVFE